MKKVEAMALKTLHPLTITWVVMIFFMLWVASTFTNHSAFWCILPVLVIAYYLPLVTIKLIKPHKNASIIALFLSLWIVFASYSQFSFNYVTHYFEWVQNNQLNYSFKDQDSIGKIRYVSFNQKFLPQNGIIGVALGSDLRVIKKYANTTHLKTFLDRAIYNSDKNLKPLKNITIILASISTLFFLNSFIMRELEIKKENERLKKIEEDNIQWQIKIEKLSRENDLKKEQERINKEALEKERIQKEKEASQTKETERLEKKRKEYDALPGVVKKNATFEDYLKQ